VRSAWLVLVALGGCYDPQFQVGLPCSPAGDCPSGQVCAADRTCQLTSGGGDAAPVGDGGGTPDAMEIPLESWFVSFQHPTIARADDVAAVPGGYALVGSSLVFLVDPRGEVVWQRQLDIQAYAVGGVPGGMVVAGSMYPELGAVGLDGEGQIIWQKSYADQESASANAVISIPGTPDAVLIGNSNDAADVGSAWLVRVDGSGQIVWQKRFTLASGMYATGGTATDDGGVVVAATSDGATLEERDMLAFKVDADGDLRWQKRVSGGDNEWGESAGTGVDGTVWVIGGTWANSFGAADIWLVEMNGSNGAIGSQHRIGTTAQDNGVRVFPYAATGATIVGETAGAGNTDFFVAEIKDGAITTQYRVGSSGEDYAAGAAYDGGGVVLFGDTDAYGDNIGFFAAGVPMPEGLDGACAEGHNASQDMAVATATATNLSLTVTDTTATATDLDGSSTAVDVPHTAECQ
jgi:hypothetical protein